jgi:hypothetical protein
MLRAAAAVHGVSMTRWIRETVVREAILTLLSAQNRPVRLRPGSIIWAVAPDLTVVAKKVAMGDERGYLVGPADVPRQVDLDGAGYVIDIIGMGAGYVVGKDSFRWMGRPFRKGVVAPVVVDFPKGENHNAQVSDRGGDGGPAGDGGLLDEHEGDGRRGVGPMEQRPGGSR